MQNRDNDLTLCLMRIKTMQGLKNGIMTIAKGPMQRLKWLCKELCEDYDDYGRTICKNYDDYARSYVNIMMTVQGLYANIMRTLMGYKWGFYKNYARQCKDLCEDYDDV